MPCILGKASFLLGSPHFGEHPLDFSEPTHDPNRSQPPYAAPGAFRAPGSLAKHFCRETKWKRWSLVRLDPPFFPKTGWAPRLLSGWEVASVFLGVHSLSILFNHRSFQQPIAISNLIFVDGFLKRFGSRKNGEGTPGPFVSFSNPEKRYPQKKTGLPYNIKPK